MPPSLILPLPPAGVIPLVPAASCVLLVEAAVAADMPGWSADFGLRMMRDTMKLPAPEYFKVTMTVSRHVNNASNLKIPLLR